MMPPFLLTLLPGSSALWRIAAYGLLVIGIFGYGYVKGNQHGTAKLADYQAAQLAKATIIVTKQGAVTERVVTKYVKTAGETKTVTNTIEKEIIRYESAKLDLCPLSNGFVSLHDSAALGSVPNPASATNGTASGVTANQALGTVTKNYATYHETADRLRALQDWTRQQYELTRKK